MNIPFIDLIAQRKALSAEIDQALNTVLDHGRFIMGPEVGQLEKELSTFCGVSRCVTCASGTDALLLPLMAWEIGPGDAVFVPSMTFISSAEVVLLLGAVPVFVDVDAATFTMNPDSLSKAIEAAEKEGINPRVVIPVDLFGQPADYGRINEIAKRRGIKVLADAAQSFGGSAPGGAVGTLADATASSFFPAKPLGCYGDGGAIFTADEELAEILESIRLHGRGDEKYDNVRIGLNGRLDTMQAAVLLVKLAAFPDEFKRRQALAGAYTRGLGDILEAPVVTDGYGSAWASYTLKAGSRQNRDSFQRALSKKSIPTQIYYPKPLHRQKVFASHNSLAPDGCPVSDDLSGRVFSLPFHPYMTDDTLDQIVHAVREIATSISAAA